MKTTHYWAGATIIAMLASGSAFAVTHQNTGYQKWQHDRAMALCADYEAQYKDAVSFRGARTIPASTEDIATKGTMLCHGGDYTKGDQELSTAITMLHLTPSAGQLDDVD